MSNNDGPTYKPPLNHCLQSGYANETLRKWQNSGTELHPWNLMCPIFIVDIEDEIHPIDSIPGVSRYGVKKVVEMLKPLVANGLSSVLLFGVPTKVEKDDDASSADFPGNPVGMAIHVIKQNFPKITIACDVCLCSYTSNGHCGIVETASGLIKNQHSIDRIARLALYYAHQGAHIVAPSDMMDGRVGAIKDILSKNSLSGRVSVLSYSAKFASAFYGPFREASKSAPSFGDRKCYQLPPGSSGLAKRALDRDVEEGADMLMVKPGMTYLDVVKETKQRHPNHPLFVYQTSGEYAMIHHGAQAGAFDLNEILMETLTCMRRAGADVIVSYYTPMILKWFGNT